jgi:hypothetical protein
MLSINIWGQCERAVGIIICDRVVNFKLEGVKLFADNLAQYGRVSLWPDGG